MKKPVAKILSGLAFLFLFATCAFAASEPPLVIKNGVIQQLPAGDTLSRPADLAYVDVNQGWTAAQRAGPVTLALSGSTTTPNFNSGQNFTLTLVHASCPCTFANPSTTPVAGQSGVIEIIQSGTGADTLSWGGDYTASGGIGSVTLTVAANARDYLSYYVADSTHIVLSPGVSNASH